MIVNTKDFVELAMVKFMPGVYTKAGSASQLTSGALRDKYLPGEEYKAHVRLYLGALGGVSGVLVKQRKGVDVASFVPIGLVMYIEPLGELTLVADDASKKNKQ